MFKKILIINPFGIGDVLFTTPIIHALKDAWPGINIGYLCNRRAQPVLSGNPYIDYFFVYERDDFQALRRESFSLWVRRIFEFLNKIKKEHFDLCLDFSLNSQYGYFCWFAGIKQRIGYNFKNRGFFLTKRIALSGYRERHVVDYYGELLKLLGIEVKHKKLELYLKDEEVKRTEAILREAGLNQADILVGIIPGAGRSWGKDAYLKHWPPESFAQLADKIVENKKAKIIIMGDFSEKDLAKKVINKMKYKAVDLAGSTSIGELAALLSRMHMVITNDGGPLHMAVALGVRTVSIFGPVSEKIYGPYSPLHDFEVMGKDMPCRPCYQDFRLPLCHKERECISSISVEDVYGAVMRLW